METHAVNCPTLSFLFSTELHIYYGGWEIHYLPSRPYWNLNAVAYCTIALCLLLTSSVPILCFFLYLKIYENTAWHIKFAFGRISTIMQFCFGSPLGPGFITVGAHTCKCHAPFGFPDCDMSIAISFDTSDHIYYSICLKYFKNTKRATGGTEIILNKTLDAHRVRVIGSHHKWEMALPQCKCW